MVQCGSLLGKQLILPLDLEFFSWGSFIKPISFRNIRNVVFIAFAEVKPIIKCRFRVSKLTFFWFRNHLSVRPNISRSSKNKCPLSHVTDTRESLIYFASLMIFNIHCETHRYKSSSIIISHFHIFFNQIPYFNTVFFLLLNIGYVL